jgi:hypothetical protein
LNVASKDNERPDFYVFGVIDANGDTHRDVVPNTGDDIYIAALTEGDYYEEFESDAYHLKEWAAANGFTYFVQGFKWSSLGKPLTAEMIYP